MAPSRQAFVASQSVLHSHEAAQLMPPAQAPLLEQSTSQGPAPQNTPAPQASAASQSISQRVACVQSTPPAHASSSEQSTSHGRPSGQVTPAAHASGLPHSITQVAPTQLVHSSGHTMSMHQPSTQSLPGAQSEGALHRKSRLRVSNEQPTTNSVPTIAASGFRSFLPERGRRRRPGTSWGRSKPAVIRWVLVRFPGFRSVHLR